MAEIVRRRSFGGVLPFGRLASTSGSNSAHCASVSIAPPLSRGAKRPQAHPVQARTRPSCLVAERCWDQVRWAIEAYAWRFESSRGAPGTRNTLMPAIHPKARTTPAVRAEIARSREPTGVLAGRYSVSTETIRKWRKRGPGDCQDHSSRPHRLPWKATEEERAIVCALRRATGFPLDDLTFVVSP